MKLEDLFAVLIIVVGILSWIINNVLAAKKQNEAQARLRQGPRPDRQAPERGRKVDAETERFLEEIKRRRRLAVDRDQPKPAKPPERMPAEKKPSAPAPKAARPAVANRQAPGAKQLGKMSTPAPAQPSAATAAAPAPQAAHVAPVVNTFNSFIPSPALKQVSGLLRTKATLQTAFILREVFDRPLSRRRRGRRAGSL